jgi:uncharacterized RDD family membrane protein YckC
VGGPAAATLSASEPEYAGFGVRAAANLIDGVVEFGVSFAAHMVAMMVLAVMAALGAGPEDWLERVTETGAFDMALGVAAMIIFHTLAEGFGGATIGKAIFGLRVRQTDLAPCRPGPALVRNLAFVIDSFFFGLVAYQAMSSSTCQQRLGDKWAGTVVVKASSLDRQAHQVPSVAPGILFSLAVTGAIVTIGSIARAL